MDKENLSGHKHGFGLPPAHTGVHVRATVCAYVYASAVTIGQREGEASGVEPSECRPTAAAIRMRIRIRRVGALIMLATGNWKWANGQWITSGQGRNGFSGWRGGGEEERAEVLNSH